MALLKNRIVDALVSGQWTCSHPVNKLNIGPNSVDVSLSAEILEMIPTGVSPDLDAQFIDLHNQNSFKTNVLSCSMGLVLLPGRLYLGSIGECFNCDKPLMDPVLQIQKFYFQVIEGRSTVGRTGLSIHSTAGKGDYGFKGYFTLEMSVIVPVKIYAGDHIAQIFFEEASGISASKYDSVYGDQIIATPPVLGVDRMKNVNPRYRREW